MPSDDRPWIMPGTSRVETRDDRIFCECGGLLQGQIAPDMKICGTVGREFAKESSVEPTPEQLANMLPLTECSSKRVVRRVPTATSAALHSAARYVDVKCSVCGWRHLIGPGERDHPCEAIAPCPGKVSDPDDRTFECVPQGFRARVAALLRRIEWGGGDGPPVCVACESWQTNGRHAPDCELATMIRETEG